MKFRVLRLLAAVAVLVGGAPFARSDDAPQTFRVGGLFAQTGEIAPQGTEVLRGAQLAVSESQKSFPVELIAEDVQSMVPRAAVAAAQKVITRDRVDAAVTMIIEEAQPIAPLFESAQRPLVVFWDSNQTLHKIGRYIFSNGFSTERAGETMAQFAVEKLGLRRVAVVAHVNPWAEVITPAFSKRFQEMGGRIVFSEKVNPDQTDFRTVITRLKAAKPDSVYLPMVPMTSASFLKQLREQDVNLPLLSGDPIVQEVIDAAAGGAEGLYQTSNWTDKSTELSALYRAKFSSEPADITLVALGYDGMHALIAAAKHSRENGVTLVEALNRRFGPSRSADRVQRVFRITNGKPVMLGDSGQTPAR